MGSRRQRSLTEPIYLLKMKPIKNKFMREFNVVGTSGEIYTVKINQNPSCSCPDNECNGNICKHIYFIFLRVMNSWGNIKSKYKQEKLLTIFKNIPHFISDDIAYNNAAKNNFANHFKEKTIITQKLGDICPICLIDIDTKSNLIDYCKYGCGKSVHKVCFNMWNKSSKSNTCVFCRSNWEDLDEYDNSGVSDDSYEPSYESDDSYEPSYESDDLSVYSDSSQYSDFFEFEEPNELPIIKKNIVQNSEQKLKLKDLKEMCNKINIPTYGTKSILFKRLQDSSKKYKVIDLKNKCKESNLSPSGNKQDLIDRLINNKKIN